MNEQEAVTQQSGRRNSRPTSSPIETVVATVGATDGAYPGGAGVGAPTASEVGIDSPASKKLSPKEIGARLAAGRKRAALKRLENAVITTRIQTRKARGGPAAIDYDLLADAMLRAEARKNLGGDAKLQGNNPKLNAPVAAVVAMGGHPPSTVDHNRVAEGSPLEQMLAQLSYPADKEGQVIAMICANAAPSWGDTNMEITDSANPPVWGRALLEHMREYCRGLVAERPAVRLVPKYRLATGEAAQA